MTNEKDKKLLFSPLFLKYQADFEKDPRSRVFAPLAEIYRKVGMTDKAMEILSNGLRFHPTYVIGHLGLAFCYYDIRQHNLAYNTLKPLINENRDNIRLQKLYADICMQLSKKDEALETLKYLLFINPRDKETASLVTELEQELENAAFIKHEPIIIPEETPETHFEIEPTFHVEKLTSEPKEDFDDWMTVSLGTETPKKKEVEQEKIEFKIEWNKDSEPLLIPKPDHSPVVTHTLVDLYCGQGHLEKALEILEKILILNPGDQRTIDKKNEIMALISPQEMERMEHIESADQKGTDENTEEDGRKQLMDFIDEHVHIEAAPIELKQDNAQLEEKYTKFLRKIQKRALDYQSRI